MILHGLRHWYERRGTLYQGGQRISRHYYDAYRIARTETGDRALADRALGLDCVRHARLFFNRPDLDLASAKPGSFTLAPTPEMEEPLAADYRAMVGMVFGEVPAFRDVLDEIQNIEARLNEASEPE